MSTLPTMTCATVAPIAEVDVTYTDHDDLVHAVTVPCTPLPIPGLVVAPGITGTGALAGTWTVVHAPSGLMINVPPTFTDPPAFTGQFPTKAGATAFARALAEYYPYLDFTADATEVRAALLGDPFVLGAALNDGYVAECAALTEALAGYVGASEVDAFLAREHRLRLAWQSAAQGRADARHLAAVLRRVEAELHREIARYQPARRGRFPYWQHECGHVEALTEAPDHGGCDACESGSDDPRDWRPLYTRISSEETGDTW